MYFQDLCHAFSQLPQVEAIALGGSRAGTHYDECSDYDLYIYCAQLPPEEERRSILERTCSYQEIGNSFWETEDDCILKDGVPIDILYRSLDAFSRDVAAVVEQFQAHNGYTTCMWHNLLHSKIIYDPQGRFADLQNRFHVPYPEALRQAILQNNLRLLTGNLPSYDSQIFKALQRNDLVSINHRTAAFLESYFDILFALNRMTHPGEKRMVELLKAQAQWLPEQFEENLAQLFDCLFAQLDHVPEILKAMVNNLKAILSMEATQGRREVP